VNFQSIFDEPLLSARQISGRRSGEAVHLERY
jgi:hypothetical protein